MDDKENKKLSLTEIKKLFSFLRPYRFRIIIICLCTVFLSLITVFQPLLRQRLIDDGILEKDLNVVIHSSFLILGLYALNQLFSAIQILNYTYINKLLPFRLFQRAFNHLLKLPVSFFKDSNNTQIIWNIEYDVSNIARISDSVFVTSLVQGLCMIGGIVGLIIINWKLAILVAFLIPIKILLNNYFSKKRTKIYNTGMAFYSKFAEWMGETVHGVILIKLWQEFRQRRMSFTRLRRDIIRNGYSVDIIELENNVFSSAIDELLQVAFYILGAILIFNNQLTLGGFFSFSAYSGLVINAITFLTKIRYYFDPIRPSLKRYSEFLEIKEESSGSLFIPDDRPIFKFINVTLSYDGKTNAIEDVSFEMQAGEKVAVVGANGSGKSSLILSMLRMYKISKGEIIYCGININDIKLEQYRKLFSQVEQKIFLFNSSIRGNIDPSYKIHDEQIIKAAEIFGIREFIDNLNDGLDTIVGVDGAKISGGERQKVVTLRAWLKPHKILILDEATNNLDVESERLLNDLIVKKRDSEILFIVTHRADILREMDKILVMDKGKLVGQGVYNTLLESCPEFFRLINKQ